jgi:tetratricopeptide (TPR) repeat protein
MSTAVVVGIAGALTVGAALLPARGQAPAVRPLAANPSDISYVPADDLEGQIAALRSRADAQPADSRTTGALALLLIEQARQAADPTFYAQASDAIARSFDAQPRGNHVALAAKAALLSSQHRFAAALVSADAALRLDPYSTAALGVRVDALTELGRLPEAIRAAREFDSRQPGLAATTRLAYQAELRGDDPVAQRYFSAARRDASNPTTGAFVEYHLGELARRAGRLEVANAHYRAALALVPNDAAATAGRARVHALRGQTAQAIAVLSELVARVPLPEHLITLGELHLLAGDEAAASAQFDVVRASAELARSSGVRPDLELAWFEADHGDPRRALQLARAEWGKRQPPMVADALAWALHANGRDAAALRFTRLATAYGGDARSWHHRGLIEASLGMDAEAVTHLRRALTVDAGYSPWQAEQVRTALARLGVRP